MAAESVEVSPSEKETLKLVIDEYLKNLAMEISHTDSFRYKEVLEEKNSNLRSFLSKLH